MKDVIIGFSTPKDFNLLAWIIRKVEGAPFSHVYFKYYDDETNQWIIFQASGLLVNMISDNSFMQKEDIVKEVTLTCADDVFIKFKQRAEQQLGIPYGIADLVGIGLVRLAKVFGMSIGNPLDQGKSAYICSRLVGEDSEEFLGVKINKNINAVEPIDVYNAVVSKN
jgi:hypothetical protein